MNKMTLKANCLQRHPRISKADFYMTHRATLGADPRFRRLHRLVLINLWQVAVFQKAFSQNAIKQGFPGNCNHYMNTKQSTTW